jgi:hypothetical protein
VIDNRDRPEHAIVLDNCALNGIIESDGNRGMAEKIRLAVTRGRAAIWTCPSLILETIAGSATDPVMARKKLAFLREVSGGNMLRTTGSLLKWEGKHGYFPFGSDRFMSRYEEQDIYDQSLLACDAGGRIPHLESGSEHELRQLIYEEKEQGRAMFIRARDAAREAVVLAFEAAKSRGDINPSELQDLTESDGSVSFPALGKWLLSMGPDEFAGWVSTTLKQTGYDRTATAKDLRSLLYTTSAAGYLFAQIATNYITGRNWARNDAYDAQYCVGASQTRALVTLDADLTTMCERMLYRPFGLASTRGIGQILTG